MTNTQEQEPSLLKLLAHSSYMRQAPHQGYPGVQEIAEYFLDDENTQLWVYPENLADSSYTRQATLLRLRKHTTMDILAPESCLVFPR